jgi:hypothetical protein
MALAATGLGALDEAIVFLKYFKDLPVHRQPGKVVYPLEEILLLCPARGAGQGGELRRHCPVRREEARTLAPVPPFSRRRALA